MRIEHLRVNHLENPIGYDFSYLTLSWKVKEAAAKFSDEVQVIISETDDMRNPIYDSGIMHDFRQCMLEVQISLKPRMRYFWKVSVGTQFGEKAESRTEWFETAKMEEKWTADWISVPENQKQMPVLYRDFEVVNKIKKARLYIFGAGLYEVNINGIKAGDEYLLPGYHSYDLLMEYQTFDITGMLEEGNNRISVLLGEGWYKGRFGFDDIYLNLYGDRKKCIAELYLEYELGETTRIITDASW
ncbi:MAG: alpha-L-rhamnosidase N-terminal domain-containing protein, partial [Lachnospiraceae bacterium]|nr:alpha-L-rhamnosidase N-terminal domain-containing protein [Lachnospiraceae bacterium]